MKRSLTNLRLIIITVVFSFVCACCPVKAYNNESVSKEFIVWTNNVMESTQYDVVNKDGISVKEKFITDNTSAFQEKNYSNICTYFQKGDLRYSYTGEEYQMSRSAVTRTPYKLFYHSGKNSVCNFEATVKLSVTIRVDDNTGVIRSYEGPYLTLVSLSSNIVNGEMKDITTKAELSSTRRTVTVEGSYDIVLYPANIQGAADQVFGRYNDSFVAG